MASHRAVVDARLHRPGHRRRRSHTSAGGTEHDLSQFLVGAGFGLIAVALNFGLLWFATRRLFSRRPDKLRFLIPLVYIVRYLLFGAMIFLFLKLRLGDIWGLLVGVTVGMAGYMAWQVIDARRTRSS